VSAPRRWRPQRSPRRPGLIIAIAVLGVAAVVVAVTINARTAAAAGDRPRLIESGADATVDGGAPPADRLRAGAQVVAGKAKLRLQWDDGSIADLGADGKLAILPAGKGLELRDGFFGALVSPQEDNRRFVVTTPFGEVATGGGRFTIILSSAVAIVHADAGYVRIKPAAGQEHQLEQGLTERLGKK
jgi:ferric-dicitrate binding protein FerR (iron transport regulator)